MKNFIKTQKETRVAIASPLIALIGIAIAIMLSPWFDWVSNALSDLGNYNNGLGAAIVFNASLILTGALLALFTMRLIKNMKDIYSQIGMGIFFVSAVFLILIGIFSENAGKIHFWVSVGFFFTFPFAMWAIGLSFLRFSHLRLFSVISLLLPFVSIYMWQMTFNGNAAWTGMAIPEIVTAMTAISWFWMLCILLAKDYLQIILHE